MNEQVLERLLMDEALGALSDDVAALLASYLEHDADAARRAAQYARAVADARAVLRNDVPRTLPAFPNARLQDAARAQRRVRRLTRVVGLAAALALGVCVGSWWNGPARSDGAMDRASNTASYAPGARVVRVSDRGQATRFWSAAHLLERARNVQDSQAGRLVWDSVVGQPRVRR